MRIISYFKITLLISLLFLGSIGFISKVNAIEYGGLGGKPAYPDPSNPRSKSIFIYTLEPGSIKDDGILVVNNTPEPKTVLIYSTDSQKSSDGSFACEQLSDEKSGVGGWITLEKSEVTLQASTNEIIPFKINIPQSASVGEENGCILIQEKKAAEEVSSGVSLSFRTGLRVAITIPGEQIRDISYERVNVELNENKINATVSAKNNGNVSIDTSVRLITNSILGINYNTIDNQYPILRGDTSVYNFEVERPYWGGIFFVKSELEYDDNASSILGIDSENPNKVINSDSYTIFVTPQTPALLIEILILSILIIGAIISIRKIRANKTYAKKWTKKYIVKEGEDIESIAKAHGIPWKDIAKFNKLTPPYTLKKDDKILLLAK